MDLGLGFVEFSGLFYVWVGVVALYVDSLLQGFSV